MQEPYKWSLIVVGTVFGTAAMVHIIRPLPTDLVRALVLPNQSVSVVSSPKNPQSVRVEGKEYWVVLEIPSPQNFLTAQWIVEPDQSRREMILTPPDYIARDFTHAVTYHGIDPYEYTASWHMRLVVKHTSVDQILVNEDYREFMQRLGHKNLAFDRWFGDGELVFSGGYADGPGFSDAFIGYDVGTKQVVSGLIRSCYIPVDEEQDIYGCEITSVFPEIKGVLRDSIDGLRFFKSGTEGESTLVSSKRLDWDQSLATDENVYYSAKAVELLVDKTPVRINW